jgi:hypothetical protein
MVNLYITTVIDDGNGDVIKKSSYECISVEAALSLAVEINKGVKEALEIHISL